MNLFNPPGSLCLPHFGKAYFGRLTSAGSAQAAQAAQAVQAVTAPLEKGG